MALCFSTRTSVATVLTTHPCVSRCLRVNWISDNSWIGVTISIFWMFRVDTDTSWTGIDYKSVSMASIPELLMLWSVAYLENGCNISAEILKTILFINICFVVTKMYVISQQFSPVIYKIAIKGYNKSIYHMKCTYLLIQEINFLYYNMKHFYEYMYNMYNTTACA